MVHAGGTFESRGGFLGLILGNSNNLHFGRFSGTSQSLLAMRVGPPRKGRYTVSVVLWLVGFFIVMAFAGRARISMSMALFSVSYLLLLPGLLVGTTAYNLILYPAKYRLWQRTLMCQDCGALVEAPPCALGVAMLP